MTWPRPSRRDHEAFCRVEGWERVRVARGRTGTHHVTYELHLPDGRILRTRVSHPVDRTDYGRSIGAHILRDQLAVSEEEFWACTRDGTKPRRGVPRAPAETLPAKLVFVLLSKVGLAEDDVARMSRDEAIARVNRFWAEGG
ncbi:hypothetical protein [Actinokineospora inagensis]|uniref:hypothetical protein n=1 Tax=Actinokineospora inagensis TaxID=103730 RepID=UPI00042735BA|nr:hypothetical protein [Actinokineospora inagensis]